MTASPSPTKPQLLGSSSPQPPVRFAVGERVTVRADWPERLARCHIRTPSYTRGHEGVVLRCFGAFKNPEDLAFGRPASLNNLYHVAFKRQDLWPADKAGNDVLMIELFEHWLHAAGEAGHDAASALEKEANP